MKFKQAKKWIDDLNNQKYAGYADWRPPTLEEAMSLMEPKKMNKDLYIDPVFDNKQSWIWTSDPYSGAAGAQWVVYFYGGECYYYRFYHATSTFGQCVSDNHLHRKFDNLII